MSDSEGNIQGIIGFLIILGVVCLILGVDLIGPLSAIEASFSLWFIIFLVIISIICLVVVFSGGISSSAIEYNNDKTPIRKLPKTKKTEYRIKLEDIDKMEGTEFEEFLQKLFEKMGYSAELTAHTNDYGADLILSKSGERISIQAKNHVKNVDNSAVQEVVGSLKYYKTQRGIVVSSSDFTNNAIQLAHHNHVELWNRDKLNEMIKKYPIIK